MVQGLWRQASSIRIGWELVKESPESDSAFEQGLQVVRMNINVSEALEQWLLHSDYPAGNRFPVVDLMHT